MNIDNTELTMPTKAQDENTNLLHCAFADSVTAKRIRSHTDIKYNIRRAHQTKFHVKPSVVFLKTNDRNRNFRQFFFKNLTSHLFLIVSRYDEKISWVPGTSYVL